MSVTLMSRVRVADQVLFRDLGGEAVLLNLATRRYFGLDEMGVRMWREITAQPHLAAAAQALTAEFEVDAARLEADLVALVEELAAHRLVECIEPIERDVP
jgi:hypothetical protein